MADWAKQGGASPELERNQRLQKENFERNLPPWVRDGKEVVATIGAGATVVIHGLDRMPKGWLAHSHKGDPHAIVEVRRSREQLELQNAYVGGNDVTVTLWVW